MPRRWRLWPASLAARTALALLGGLLLSQIGGLTLHGLDRAETLQRDEEHQAARRVMVLYRNLVLAQPEQRANLIDQANRQQDIAVTLQPEAPRFPLPAASAAFASRIAEDLQAPQLPPTLRPRATRLHTDDGETRLALALQLPEGEWLAVQTRLGPIWPWQSGRFFATFAAMSAMTAGLTLWAVRRLIRPVGTLAAAAEALGRDVNAAPLPEDGPRELATAAVAFNTMAARIRRTVEDRTFLVTALGHDLRTPITRLRLRAEFMEDEEQRRRMLSDLSELEAMVSATLAFGRDTTLTEPVVAVDFAALVQTVIAETADAHPSLPPDALDYAGAAHLVLHTRPVALKRAVTNLVNNAVLYGGAARATLVAAPPGMVTLHIDDQGPGIPEADMERVFLPFQRLEPSRNRETGGTGLGLAITRNIARAHGGDVRLSNRPGGGLRATLALPI